MNYSDAGCDDYDRIAHMYICQGQCYETQYYFDADETTCIDAVNNGVRGVVIIDGRKPHSILFELFSDQGAGTLIRK